MTTPKSSDFNYSNEFQDMYSATWVDMDAIEDYEVLDANDASQHKEIETKFAETEFLTPTRRVASEASQDSYFNDVEKDVWNDSAWEKFTQDLSDEYGVINNNDEAHQGEASRSVSADAALLSSLSLYDPSQLFADEVISIDGEQLAAHSVEIDKLFLS